MRKALLAAGLAMLALTSPAVARAHTLTVHKAKRVIARDFRYTMDYSAKRVGHCERQDPAAITCVVMARIPGTRCYHTERWLSYISRHYGTVALLDVQQEDDQRYWGACDSGVIVTPVDGDVTYDPPGPASPQGPATDSAKSGRVQGASGR